MVIKVPRSISNRFSPQAINEAFRRAEAVASGKQIIGTKTSEGKRAFDNFRSASAEFRGGILGGQLARKGLGGIGGLSTLKQIREQQRQQKQFQKEIIISRQEQFGQPIITQAEKDRGVRGVVVSRDVIPTGKVKERIKGFDPQRPRGTRVTVPIKLSDVQETKASRIQQDKREKERMRREGGVFKKIIPGVTLSGKPAFLAKDEPALFLSDITREAFRTLEKRGFSKKRISKIISFEPETIETFTFLSDKEKEDLKKLSKFKEGTILGILEAVEKEPEKIIVITGGSFALSQLIAGGAVAGFGAKFASKLPIADKVLKLIPLSVKRKGGIVLSRALGASYLASAGLRVIAQPTPEKKGKVLGNIIATEATPFWIGSRAGVQGVLRRNVKREIEREVNKLPFNKKEAFRSYIKQAEILSKYEPEARNIKLSNIESIKNSRAQKEIRNFLKSNKKEVVVGGSVAQTGQINIKRKLGDMDLYIDGKKSPTAMARQLANQLRKAGVQRVSSAKGQVTIAGKKSIEFHDIDRLLTNIEQVIPSWQNPRKYIIKTPEGIKIQRIGLQARRKAVAGFADPKRFATGKYKKDLQDFRVIANKLFKNAEISARKSIFFRESKIKALEKEFGVKISRKFPKETKFRKPKITIKKIKGKFKIVEVKKVKVKKVKIKKPKQLKKRVRKIKKIKVRKKNKKKNSSISKEGEENKKEVNSFTIKD